MSCNVVSSPYVLEAANVSWGAEEVTCITPVTGLSGGESFNMSSPSINYYVWFTVNAVGVDPAISGRTGIEIDLPTAYTEEEAVTAIAAAMDLEADFSALASTDGLSVAVKAIALGAPLTALGDTDSGFTLEVDRAGFGGDLGKTKGPVELTFESTLFDVTTNQTGTSLQDQIIQGTSASASMELLEMTAAKWALVVGKGFGDNFTPSAGTEVTGFGQSKDFVSSFDIGGKLIIHPVRLAASDLSRDVVFWVTTPQPESINFDGTDTQAMSIAFTALPDPSKKAEIRICTFGDHTQDLRV